MAKEPIYNEAAHIASIEERVTGLEKGMRDIVDAVRSLSSEIRQNGKTQWPVVVAALGVTVTILTSLGVLAYMPIQQKQETLERGLLKLTDVMVTQRETELINRFRQSEIDKHERRLDRLEEYVFRHYPKDGLIPSAK